MTFSIYSYVLALRENFDCLGRAYVFACNAENAVLLPNHKGLLFGRRMTRSLKPFIDIYWTCFNACTVSHANIKVDAYAVAPNSQLAGSVKRAPHLDAAVCSCELPLFLELGVYRAFYFGITGAGAG